MSEEKTNIQVTPTGDKLTIVHRHGEAAAIQNPKAVNILGSIDAPAEYYEKRSANDMIDKNQAYLEVNQKKGSITLYCDPTSPIGGHVTGQILMNPLLDRLDINKYGAVKFTEEDFIMRLKECRSIFDVQSDCLNLVDRIKNMEVNVQQKLEKRDDERANRRVLFEQFADTEIPHSFMLNAPIFINGSDTDPNEIFSVDVKYHYSDGGLKFWLESADLQDIIQRKKETAMGDVVSRFNEEIPIIYI